MEILILGLLFAIIIGFGFRQTIWSKARTLSARSWSTCQGKIEFGTVIERRTRYFSYYVAQLAYSYTTNGEYYSGYYEKVFLREKSADALCTSLKGKATFVRYKPNAPGTSTVLLEDQQSVWPPQN